MTWKCPFCGSTSDEPPSFDEPADVADVLARSDSPSPHVLYAQTGGGETYRRAMIQHGYVYVVGDARCRAPKGDGCTCLLKRDHDGPHLCPHGDWTAERESEAS